MTWEVESLGHNVNCETSEVKLSERSWMKHHVSPITFGICRFALDISPLPIDPRWFTREVSPLTLALELWPWRFGPNVWPLMTIPWRLMLTSHANISAAWDHLSRNCSSQFQDIDIFPLQKLCLCGTWLWAYQPSPNTSNSTRYPINTNICILTLLSSWRLPFQSWCFRSSEGSVSTQNYWKLSWLMLRLVVNDKRHSPAVTALIITHE